MYGSGQCDAVCITDMDALNPSLAGRPWSSCPPPPATAPTPASCPTTITDVKQLKGKKVYGLAKSVSEYCFVRNLELLGEKEADYTFSNMDPGAAAVAMQQKQKEIEAIMVWNPFVLETLNKRKDVHVLFDSTKIPNEIIDTVVVAQASLDKPGGKDFACAVIDTFYAVNQRMADPATRDDTLVALGEKFSHLDLASMKKVVRANPVLRHPQGRPGRLHRRRAARASWRRWSTFCVKHEITPTAPKVGYGTKATAGDAALRFDPTYIQQVQERK